MDNYAKEMTDKMSDAEKKSYGDYDTKERAESDLRTMIEAEEIKADKERMRMMKLCAKHKKESLNNIA